MRMQAVISVLSLIALTGCGKEDEILYSGTMTIDNELIKYNDITYYGYGFSVPTGKRVSTLNDPGNVITIQADPLVNENDTIKPYFSVNSLEDSFFLYGKYASSSAAISAFNNLTSVNVNAWTQLAIYVRPDQVWIFRTSDEKYAKIRIISTVREKRPSMPFPYAACTFEWVFQPDGTQTFPPR